MQKLNLPDYGLKPISDGKKTKIFDSIRKKYLILSPEEWVRQNFIQYLIHEQKFPANLMAIEKGLSLNGLKKRCDILCYTSSGNPMVLIECKAPQVKIQQKAFDQVARYNLHFKVPYLIVTNGITHYCAMINFETKNFRFLDEIPNYEQVQKGS